MREPRELMTRILMVAAPLVMLAALTAAWFINSSTVGLSALSFASQDTGPGAALHFGLVDKAGRTPGVTEEGVPTLSNTVLWGEEERPEDSAIVLENMLPGQCEYYLLVGNEPFTVSLTGVTYTGADGTELPLPSAEKLPLAQCLGLYLIPVQETFDWTKVGETVANGAPHSTPAITLGREVSGQLKHAVWKDLPASVPLTPEGVKVGEPYTAYILAIYCDPLYLQHPEFLPEGETLLSNNLPGAISFSLAFPKPETEAQDG